VLEVNTRNFFGVGRSTRPKEASLKDTAKQARRHRGHFTLKFKVTTAI
jgi:hypothetical protein